MATSTIQKVVLVGGSGHLGPFILTALQAEGYDVTVVTRQNSDATFPPTTKVVKVEEGYPDEQMLDAFTGADAVVLSLAFVALDRHSALVDVSIKAGVKRLIASTYGCNDENAAVVDMFPIAKRHHDSVDYLRPKNVSNWSWTSISCGLFFDLCIQTGFFGFDTKNYKATICGDGNYRFSATTCPTIGTAVARVLAKPEETANRNVFISSFEVSLNEIFSAIKKTTGVSNWTVTNVSTDDMVAQGREELAQGSMFGLAKLALVSQLRPEYGNNFNELGKLDNELLGIKSGDTDAAVANALERMPK